jgi:hypothetical protein
VPPESQPAPDQVAPFAPTAGASGTVCLEPAPVGGAPGRGLALGAGQRT